MEDSILLLKIGLWLILIPLAIIVLLVILKQFKKKPKQTFNNDQTPNNAKKWLDTVKLLFNNNEALEFRAILVKCGVPKEVAFSGNSEEIEKYYPFSKGSFNRDIFNTYALVISNRNSLQKYPLQTLNSSEYGLNLPNDEILYQCIVGSVLYEEKTIKRNIAYSGMRWNNGLLRAGTLSVISNEKKNFVPQDAGKIFITNKRVIFIGKQNNITKAILLKNIITYTLYQDGIIINQPNKKALLFNFTPSKDESLFVQDGLNIFIAVVNRILDESEKIDYTQDVDLDKELKSKGYDEYLRRISYWAITKDEITTTQIMRNFEVGFSRATEILNQLVFIGIVDKSQMYKVTMKDPEILLQKLKETQELNNL